MRVLRVLRASLPYLAGLVIFVGMGNLLWYIGENLRFGGSALGGFVHAGHYYLALHGTNTEVSQAVWERIRLHEMSVLLSVPLVVFCAWYWLVGHFFPSMMGFHRGEAVAERVRMIQASGMPLASRRCGGNIAGIGLGGPFFAVAVYPNGITIRLFPQQPVAIRKAELVRVETPKRRAGRVQITHRSPDISSPVVLFLWPSSDLAGALDWLAARAEDSASMRLQGDSKVRDWDLG